MRRAGNGKEQKRNLPKMRSLLPEGGLMAEQFYRYIWGNNEKRAKMKGRICRVLARGKMNTCVIQFMDSNETESVSRNSLRKYNGKEAPKS